MGAQAPWLKEVRQMAQALPWPCEVRVDVADMARLMAECDLAVGAAGSTTWERCCLGLPTLLLALADNQRKGARALQSREAALYLELSEHFDMAFPQSLARLISRPVLERTAYRAAEITDGRGCPRVLQQMLALSSDQRAEKQL
jgi:spore coat polysaccharide biosynthesis predicted glycosyltransferase SpsG